MQFKALESAEVKAAEKSYASAAINATAHRSGQIQAELLYQDAAEYMEEIIRLGIKGYY